MVWDLEGILIWLHRTPCAVEAQIYYGPSKKNKCWPWGQIEHCLLHYHDILLLLGKVGTNNPSLITIDLDMNLGGSSHRTHVGNRVRPRWSQEIMNVTWWWPLLFSSHQANFYYIPPPSVFSHCALFLWQLKLLCVLEIIT
jgi:hypothetical protein